MDEGDWQERESLISDADSDTESEKVFRLNGYFNWGDPSGYTSSDDEDSDTEEDELSVLTDGEDVSDLDDHDWEKNTPPASEVPQGSAQAVPRLHLGSGDETKPVSQPAVGWASFDNNDSDEDYILEGCLSPRELYMGLDTRLCWVAHCWELKMAREAALQAKEVAALPLDGDRRGAGDMEVQAKCHTTLGRLKAFFSKTRNKRKRHSAGKPGPDVMSHQNLARSQDIADIPEMSEAARCAPDLVTDVVTDPPDLATNPNVLAVGKSEEKRPKSFLRRLCGRMFSRRRKGKMKTTIS